MKQWAFLYFFSCSSDFCGKQLLKRPLLTVGINPVLRVGVACCVLLGFVLGCACAWCVACCVHCACPAVSRVLHSLILLSLVSSFFYLTQTEPSWRKNDLKPIQIKQTQQNKKRGRREGPNMTQLAELIFIKTSVKQACGMFNVHRERFLTIYFLFSYCFTDIPHFSLCQFKLHKQDHEN